MTQDSLPLIVSRLLRKNNIEFDKTELAFQIQSHPSYPSLHAITGVLDHFKIENVAASIPIDEDSLNQLPKTFLAQLDNDLVAVTQNKSNLGIYDSSLNQDTLSTEEFLEKFTGVVVAVEPTEESEAIGKPNPIQNALWIIAVIIFLALMVVSEASATALAFLGLSLAGLGVSMAILKQEFGMSSTLGSAFCSNATEKKDCDAVIHSDGAKILGKYKISDLSLVYFLSMALVSTLSIALNKRLDVLYYTTLLSVPITFYSIYYQWAVVKKWCMLCLSIAAVLWLQTTLSLLTLTLDFPIQANNVLLFALFSLAIFAGWSYLRPKQDELKDGYAMRLQYFKFKRNFELFSTMLNTSNPIDTQVNNPLEIVLGNERAVTEITIVTNPFCGHCRAVHNLIEDILSQHREVVKLNIRFNISLDNKKSDLIRICTKLLEIHDAQGKDICLMAMSEIYGDSAPDVWLEKWTDCQNPETYLKLLETQKQWCTDQSINFTPEILINGRSFPKNYERPDLIYFIEDLHEMTIVEGQNLSESSVGVTV